MSDALDRARAALIGTTDGPWEVGEEIDGWRAGRRTVVRHTDRSTARPSTKRIVTVDQTRPHWDGCAPDGANCAEANVAFIAAARTLVPELIAEIERLQEPLIDTTTAAYLEEVGAELNPKYREVYETLKSRYRENEEIH